MPRTKDYADQLHKYAVELRKLAGSLSQTVDFKPSVKLEKRASSMKLDPNKVLDFMLFFGR